MKPKNNPRDIIEHQISDAAAAVKQGGIVAYPTEAVYGLGCDPFNEVAVARIFALKNRPKEKTFIIIAANWEQLTPVIATLTPSQKQTISPTWPGAMTWLLPANEALPYHLANKNGKIAARITDHPIAKALCIAADQCVISTSANISGEAALKTANDVYQTFGDQINVIIGGSVGSLSAPTPIRDLQTLQWLRGGPNDD